MTFLKIVKTIAGITLLTLCGCSQEAKTPPTTANHTTNESGVLFQVQRDALESAKKTEAIINKAADQRKQQMDE
jgi:hypothetical protein